MRMFLRNLLGEKRDLMVKGVRIVVDRRGGRLKRRRSFVRRALRYLVSAIVGFGALFAVMMMDSRAYAAGLPQIFMGTFSDVFVGDTGSKKDEIAQMPKSGDVIKTPRTVVILGSKWKLKPGFVIKTAKSSNSKVVSISAKKGLANIRTRKVGQAKITLSSADGKTKIYQIFVEDPKVRKLKVVDFVRLDESQYITGVKYLKPTAVGCNKRKIGQIYRSIYGEKVLNIFGSGKAKVIVRYGKYKRTGSVRAKLPRMVSKDVKLSNRPKRIRVKNVPRGWTPVYRSTDPDVAVCSSEGVVAPKGNGTATIYTRIGNTYLICHVTVSGFKKSG